IGAREYDPTTGQFLSTDPLLTLDQHQSLNGYSYANNNPVTQADPTGQAVCMQDGICGGTKTVEEWETKHGKEYGDGRLGSGTAPTDSTGNTSNTTTSNGSSSYNPVLCARTGLSQYCSGAPTGPGDSSQNNGNYLSSLASSNDFWSGLFDTIGGAFSETGGIVLTASGIVECGVGVLCEAGVPSIAGGIGGVVAGKKMLDSGSDKLGRAFREADGAASGGGKSVDPGAQNPEITWSTDEYDGWQHVQDRHRIGGAEYDPETKGAFIGKGRKVQKWIQEVVSNNPASPNSGGRDGYVYEGRVNAGPDGVGILSNKQSRGLGTNRAYGIRVVLNVDGSLRTAHPIP
ncbi:RHS repeat-associated core domain-containing protein, partial [Streptomyces sp. NPDC047028]|uniref:RHS repeat-associated core domain-containing protein n=1 Tax=Streptomyces sp. NPDC047028 TaxID=3155793 RepID=UPI0033E0E15A